MPARVAFLLPASALLIVGVVAAGVLLFRGSGPPAGSAQAPVSADASPQPTGTTEPGRPQLRPEGNVCQGLLHRPDPGQEQTFPALYTKRAVAAGITIVAGVSVDDRALAVARETVERMFAHNDLEARLAEERAYVIIADRTQGILDLPEFGCVQGRVANQLSHACGVADRADYPVVTVNELDLLGDRSGPCGGLNILYHEVGHLVQGWTLEPTDYFDIKLHYQSALDAGKYRLMYAATNPNEYFAEATQAYFLSNQPGGASNRAWLKGYDPDIYALVARIYGD